ncbi:hypothetical protein CEXT_316941 [Caerostris extrusa]|uniref:Uncharacterized protein n=1 Tax=Caerostris extrusa TaxID=172846 RepID=A0AAV4WCE7_CAEEX|nr:hypothetical protein CEXT_316941 [Caerostris extrusa]
MTVGENVDALTVRSATGSGRELFTKKGLRSATGSGRALFTKKGPRLEIIMCCGMTVGENVDALTVRSATGSGRELFTKKGLRSATGSGRELFTKKGPRLLEVLECCNCSFDNGL